METTLTPKFTNGTDIRNFIRQNAKLTVEQLAEELGLPTGKVNNHIAWIKRGVVGEDGVTAPTFVNGRKAGNTKTKEEIKEQRRIYQRERNRRIKAEQGKIVIPRRRKYDDTIVDAPIASTEKPKRQYVKKAKVEAVAPQIEQFTIEPTLAKEVAKLVRKPNLTVENFKNDDGELKEVARSKMANYIIDSDVVGIIPTLPHIKCKIEQRIINGVNGNYFIGVNNVVETFEKNKEFIQANNIPMEPYCGKISDMIYDKSENTYAHLILDYCCQLPTVAKEIEYALKNNIVKKGGYVMITIAKPIRTDDLESKRIIDMGKRITNNLDDSKRCVSDKAIENYFYNKIGSKYQFVETFYYTDTYPMVLIVLKRKK